MRKRGRPPLFPGEIPARVQVTLSNKTYDRLDALARSRGVSVPTMMRRGADSVLDEQNKSAKKYKP